MLPAGTTGDHKEKEKSLVDEVPPVKSKACAKKPEAGKKKKLSENSTTKTNVFFAAWISTITAGAVLFF